MLLDGQSGILSNGNSTWSDVQLTKIYKTPNECLPLHKNRDLKIGKNICLYFLWPTTGLKTFVNMKILI